MNQYTENPNDIDFDVPFRINEDGFAKEEHDVHSPNEVYCESSNGGTAIRGIVGWEPVYGLSGQYGYSGPEMHSSENLSARLMSKLYFESDQNIFVVVNPIDDLHEEECDEPHHEDCDFHTDTWLLLRKLS